MNVLLIINDAPYGSEKAYNALRLAMTLQKEHADKGSAHFSAGGCGRLCPAQSDPTPQGYYNLERMLGSILRKGGQVSTCGTCADARGVRNLTLIEGVGIGTMSQLAQWVVEADRVLTF